MEGFTEYYLQELTVRFYWCIMVPTQRSVDNLDFLSDEFMVVCKNHGDKS